VPDLLFKIVNVPADFCSFLAERGYNVCVGHNRQSGAALKICSHFLVAFAP
jgi:hypothetical protein